MPYAYGSQISKNYISSINFLDQREILNKVLDITNEESSFLDVMELTGRSVVTNVPQYHHFVNQELYVLGTVGASPAVSGSGTATVTFALDATSFAYVQLGDLVLLKSGSVGYVTTKTSGNSTIAIKSVDNTNLTVAAADIVSFFSNAAGEGSLSPDARKWGVTKYQNQVQTFKAKFQITDIQKASKVEVDYNGKPFYMYKGQHESLVKFRGDISNALMFGRISASAGGGTTGFTASSFDGGSSAQLVDAESNPVSTTMGLDQYATLYGQSQNQGTNGTSLLSEWATLTQNLNKLRAPQEYFLFVGTKQNIAFDNLLNGLTVAGTAGSTAISAGGRFTIAGKELDLGIDTFKLYGRKYFKKYLPLLDHQYVVDPAATHAFANSAYGVPATKIKTVDSQMMDRIMVRYMANDGTDLKYREILLGGLAPVPTNERSVLEIHYQSTQGLQVLGANHLFKIK